MTRGAAVVSGLLFATVAACSGSSSDANSTPPVVHPSTPTAPRASAADYITATLNVGSQPCAVEGGFGSIWVSVFSKNQELRINPTTHRVIARIPVGKGPCGIAVGGGSVWVENFTSNNVTRIDPATNHPTTIKTGSGPYDVTYDAGAAWVTNYNDNTVTRVDAATNATKTIKVGGSPNGVAPEGRGTVIVTNRADGTISRINTTSYAVHTSHIGVTPAWTAWGDGKLWISDNTTLRSIDPTAKEVSFTDTLNDGDIVNGKVWVTDSGGSLHEVDASTGKTIGSWPLGLTNPFVTAGYRGKLWVVDFKGTKLLELDPSALK